MSVDFSGASSGQLDISAPELSFDLSGSSKADTRGTSKYIMVDASGSSLFNGMEASYDEMNIDLSGSVDVNDVTALQQYLSEQVTFDNLQKFYADINSDSKIDVRDVTTLQNVLTKK